MHAVREGFARAASAPALLAGAIAVLWWLRGGSDARNTLAAFVLWGFLSGGVLDRYARRRATRGRGFFAACGAHFGAMLRLGVVAILLNAAMQLPLASPTPGPNRRAAALVVVLAIALVTLYAQVRLVVEDRRSAAGALLASARFIRRNPSSAALYLFYLVLIGATAAVLPRLPTAPTTAGWISAVAGTARIVLITYLMLSLAAAAVALFQARLAHAGYTAAPPLEWPESPAAEAIANAERSAP